MRSPSSRKPLTVFSLAAAAVLGFVGCGGDGPSGPDTDAATQLLLEVIGEQNAGEPFNARVTLANAQGVPVEADAASTITLSVDAGAGALRGTTSGSLAAGAAQVTIEDVIYDHAEGGVQLRATASGGTAGGLSSASQPITLDFDFSRELVAFRRTIGQSQDIYLMAADGSAFVNLTDDASVDSDPAWSPDGGRIAFVSTRSGNADLWVVNVDGTGLTQVTDDQGSIRFPQWSPDGSRIAYSANVNDQRDLYVVEAPAPSTSAVATSAATQTPLQITNDPGTDNEPVWSPDGGKVFFYSNRDGPGSVWSIDFDGMVGSNPARLTLDFVFACAPGSGYSLVDGRMKLSFVGETEGQLDIWVMDFDGSNQMNVTDHAADEFYSSWMSDPPDPTATGHGSPSSSQQGARLIFDSNRDGPWQLYSVNEDGSDVIRLTNHPSDDEMPRWRPATG